MCGRYGLTLKREELDGAYPVDVILAEHHPRWNIAPTQLAPVLVSDGRRRVIDAFRWGLVPHWARDPSMGARMINARSESVATKPAFRDAWREGRRCLVLADGFYEWKRPESGRGPKRPFWIQVDAGKPFGMAGLWERWGPRDAPLHTFTVLTTRPNALLRSVHDRMPVVLPEDRWTDWVDPAVPPEAVSDALAPFPGEAMALTEVSTYVNDPKHEGEGCVAEAGRS